MFKGQIEVRKLKNWMKAIRALVDEFRLQINNKLGWQVLAINNAYTAMMEVFLKKEAFKEYKMQGNLTVAVDYEYLEHALKDASGMAEIEITKEKLITTANNTRFEIRLLHPDVIRKATLPSKLSFKAKAVLYTEDLRNGMRAADRVSQWRDVTFSVEDGKFFVEAVSESEVMEMVLGENELVKLEGENCRSSFSIDYLMPMIKAINTNTVEISLGTDEPIKIAFANDDMEVMYLLAPRVSE